MFYEPIRAAKCAGCRDGAGPDFDIAMAFQPIIDIQSGKPYAYEALVRGADGSGAATVLAKVTEANRYAFDQQCRVAAIRGAAAAGILDTNARLSINFLPNAVYSPLACIQLTLKTAAEVNFPTDRLIFEFTENEKMNDPEHVASIIACYHKMGFGTAIDDFGAGYAGLSLLARFQTDLIKLDMDLIRKVDTSPPRQVIVDRVAKMCRDLGIDVIAEGVETIAELEALRAMGITLFQGHLFAKAGFRELPDCKWPVERHGVDVMTI